MMKAKSKFMMKHVFEKLANLIIPDTFKVFYDLESFI